MAEVLVLVEHADGEVKKATLELLTAARELGEPSAVVLGGSGVAAPLRDTLAEYGAVKIYVGESDDFGFNVTRDPVHVHDLHATILHLLGFDHTRLTYKFQGRDFRLTDVFGNVVAPLIS